MEGEVRVGDTERRQVDQLLQRATGDGMLTLLEYEERSGQVWAARTRSELAEVTKDLPYGQQAAATSPAQHAAVQSRKPRWAVGIFSEARIDDPLPGQRLHAVAVMGSAVVDLRKAPLPAETFVSATAVMGGVTVHVPAGVRVETNGIAIMGGRDIKVGAAEPGAPVVRVHATAVMGGVEIKGPKTGRLAAMREGYAERQAEKAARRAEHAQRHAEHHAAQVQRTDDGWAAYDERRVARQQRRRRGPLLGIAAAVVIVAGGGAVAAGVNGDSVGVFGDRTVQATEGAKIGQFFGDVKVEVPSGSCVDFGGTHWFGDSGGPASCAQRPGATEIHMRVDGAFGDVTAVAQN